MTFQINFFLWRHGIGVCALSALVIFCGVRAARGTEAVVISRARISELVRTLGTAARISTLSVRTAELGQREAATSFLPGVTGSASLTRLGEAPEFSLSPGVSFSAGPQNIKNAGITVYQPIFTGGKLWHGYRAAAHGARVQRLTHDRTLEDLEMNAVRLFWGYIAAVNMHAATVDTRTWLEQLIGDQEKLFSIGQIIEHDLLTSKTQLSSARLEEIRAANRVRSIADQLLVFLGLAAGTGFTIDTSDSFADDLSFGLPSEHQIDLMIAGRSDISALQAQVDQLESVLQLRRSAYVPSLGAYFTQTWNNQYTADENELEAAWNVGASLSWNIFDWGKAWIGMKQTQTQVDMVRLRVDMTRDQLRVAIRDLSRRVEESRLALTIAREGVENARRALDISKIRYEEQMVTNTELLTSSREFALAQIRLIGARIEAALAAEEFRIGPAAPGAAGSVNTGIAGAGVQAGTSSAQGRVVP